MNGLQEISGNQPNPSQINNLISLVELLNISNCKYFYRELLNIE